MLLGLPAAASAAVPGVTTLWVIPTGPSTAAMAGDVNPEGQSTTYAVEWDLQSSEWCTSGGTSGSPANTTSSADLGSTDNNSHGVEVDLTGLTRPTGYCGRVIATNGDGTGDGAQLKWVQNPPDVETVDAFSTSATRATVDGTINPEGQDTIYNVEYGLASSTWCMSDGASGPAPSNSDPTDLNFTDNTVHDISVKQIQVQTGAEYCARVVGDSSGGEVNGQLMTFTVDKAGALTETVSSTGGTTAAVAGSVNPNGQTTTYAVQFGLSSSAWCTSGGATGSPAQTTAPATLGFTDEAFHEVSVDLAGLTADSDYCALVIATNVNGEVDGEVADSQVSWTQGLAPDALTFDTYSTSATTATVEGEVDPRGEDTTYAVEWDLASSTWCTSGGASGSPAHTTADTGPVSDSDFVLVSVDLTGLTQGTDYCADIVATDANGDADGGQVPWAQGAPFVDTFDANSTGLTTATIDGDVNPAGESTSYVVKYDLAGSEWCTSGGVSGSPTNATAPQILPATDGTFHDVSIDLTGLTEGDDYCAEIVASNATGSTPIDDGDQAFWTQPTPPPTLTVSPTGSGTGVVTSSPAGIDCGAGATQCTASFDPGTQVTLTATPETGSFVGIWISPPGCSTPGVTTCKVTLNSNMNILVGFGGRTTHTVTVVNQDPALGTVTSSPAGITCGAICSNAFNAGTQVTLTATADAGDVFTSWSGGGCSGTRSCTVTLNTDTTVTATFTANPSSTPPPTTSTTKCVVPKVTGKKLAAAKRAITSHHCGVGKITKVKSSKTHKGKVISQSPKPGKHLEKGSKVALKVGK